MIYFGLSLRNPWHKDGDFDNLYCRSGMITKHKAWEFEVIKSFFNIAEVTFHWKIKTDHAGPSLEIGLFGYSIHVQIYDTRHWNRETNDWEVYS